MRLKDKKIVSFYIYLTSNVLGIYEEKTKEAIKRLSSGAEFTVKDSIYNYVSKQYHKLCKGAFKVGDKVTAIYFDSHMGNGKIVKINNCETGALIKFDNKKQWLAYGSFIKKVDDKYGESQIIIHNNGPMIKL